MRIFSTEANSLADFRNALMGEINSRRSLIKEYEASLNCSEEEIQRQCFEFAQEKTTPLMIVVENFADLCNRVDGISALMLDKCFSMTHYCNIYVVAFFEPDDYKNIGQRTLYYGFNPDRNVLLLGGQFDRQDICEMPQQLVIAKKLQFNTGLMSYKDNYYPILMPCGEVQTETVDEDEKDIFL